MGCLHKVASAEQSNKMTAEIIKCTIMNLKNIEVEIKVIEPVRKTLLSEATLPKSFCDQPHKITEMMCRRKSLATQETTMAATTETRLKLSRNILVNMQL